MKGASSAFAQIVQVLLAHLHKMQSSTSTSVANIPVPADGSRSSHTDHSEISYWESVDKTSAAELRLYLQKYPDGEFADLARAKLEKAEGTQAHSTSTGSTALPAPAVSVTLQVRSMQGSLMIDAEKLVAVYCVANRLTLFGSAREFGETHDLRGV